MSRLPILAEGVGLIRSIHAAHPPGALRASGTASCRSVEPSFVSSWVPITG